MRSLSTSEVRVDRLLDVFERLGAFSRVGTSPTLITTAVRPVQEDPRGHRPEWRVVPSPGPLVGASAVTVKYRAAADVTPAVMLAIRLHGHPHFMGIACLFEGMRRRRLSTSDACGCARARSRLQKRRGPPGWPTDPTSGDPPRSSFGNSSIDPLFDDSRGKTAPRRGLLTSFLGISPSKRTVLPKKVDGGLARIPRGSSLPSVLESGLRVAVELLVRQADASDEDLVGPRSGGRRSEAETGGEGHVVVLIHAVTADSESTHQRLRATGGERSCRPERCLGRRRSRPD